MIPEHEPQLQIINEKVAFANAACLKGSNHTLADTDSWYVTTKNQTELPLWVDANFQKKPAFAGVLQGVKSNKQQ